MDSMTACTLYLDYHQPCSTNSAKVWYYVWDMLPFMVSVHSQGLITIIRLPEAFPGCLTEVHVIIVWALAKILSTKNEYLDILAVVSILV
jgi:hypothetical protein